ncbi:FGGY family carbohydrate kinase [Cohnella faecalis]|uniref:ATP:glycerol 3-phosphotransferase n=1 Tax=Cohnella faecalis TaxID=2315694 RepID=A0A398CK19_9BACL|nr:glycerol kinase GlpK [Cohnella faecalis]RIE03656.1 glycerol kinase GlpK [Cohnella faecalis]
MSGGDRFLLTVDQSTAGTKAVLTDADGRIRHRHGVPHRQIYPRDGWVEHDPIELYDNVKTVIRDVMEKANVGEESIIGVTITNQRETAVVWNRRTGLPVANAIVWQCRRTADFCDKLRREGHEPLIREKTGLLLDPYFSAAKWRWLLDNREDGASDDELLAGTIDSWLIWKLTGGRVHATDYTNASRTQLFNIHTLQWDEELAELFGVPISMLPDVYPSDRIYGCIEDVGLFASPMPIAGVIGDSQAALFGQQCLRPGMAKGTYGTGTSVLMHVGDKPAAAGGGLVSAIAWGAFGRVEYAVEAIIHSTGDCLNWARDQMGLFQSYDELNRDIAEAGDTGGVYLVPAFVGLGAPHWNPRARAAIIGMNRSTGRRHLLRAAVESIAYQVADAVRLLERETGIPVGELRVDGGASANELLMQFQADLLNAEVVCSEAAELSALGSAFMGGLALGVWDSAAELNRFYRSRRIYRPEMNADERARLDRGWQAAVKGVLAAEDHLNG